METLDVYFAGELFDHKDLVGNAMLAAHVDRLSSGRYRCMLPQHLEQATGRAVEIRNQDLKQLLLSDLALFNFDGTELDSGTVVEFMYAKFLDIPSVVVRSDFRSSGDQGKDGDSWNLMCSFYPRTQILQFNAMADYQTALSESGSLEQAIDRLYGRIASHLIDALDRVKALTPLLKDDRNRLMDLYRWAIEFPGGGLKTLCSSPAFIETVVKAKIKKGIA